MNFFSNLLQGFRLFDKGGSVSGTVIVNLVSAALMAIISIVLARVLGIVDYGLYVYVISTTGLVGVLTTWGMPTLITRQIATWIADSQWNLFNGIILFGGVLALASSCLFGVILYACGPFLGKMSSTPDFRLALGLAIGVMILQSLERVAEAALQGMQIVARSLVPRIVVLPACLIAFAISAYLLHMNPNAVILLTAQVVIAFAVVIYQLHSLIRHRPVSCRGVSYTFFPSLWLRSALPFLGNGVLFVINTQADVLLLGYFKGVNSAAIYQVGTRGAQLLVLALGAIATAIQPRIVTLYVSGDSGGVSKLVTYTTRLGFAIALIGALVLVGFGEPIIRLLYGPSFVAAAVVLSILVLARLVNASVGSLGPFLNMTGKERLMLNALAMESAANVMLNILLIPRWGMDGSAFATGISMAVMNVVLAAYVYRKWGIDVSIFGRNRHA